MRGGGANWIIQQCGSKKNLHHKSLVKFWFNQQSLSYYNVKTNAVWPSSRGYTGCYRGYTGCYRGYTGCSRGYTGCSRGYTEKFQRLYWFLLIIIPLCGPSCKQRLERFSAKLKFQDGPSVAIKKNWVEFFIVTYDLFTKFLEQIWKKLKIQ